MTKTPASDTVMALPGYPELSIWEFFLRGVCRQGGNSIWYCVNGMPQKDTLDRAAYTCLLVSYRRLSPQLQFSLSGVTLVYLSQCPRISVCSHQLSKPVLTNCPNLFSTTAPTTCSYQLSQHVLTNCPNLFLPTVQTCSHQLFSTRSHQLSHFFLTNCPNLISPTVQICSQPLPQPVLSSCSNLFSTTVTCNLFSPSVQAVFNHCSNLFLPTVTTCSHLLSKLFSRVSKPVLCKCSNMFSATVQPVLNHCHMQPFLTNCSQPVLTNYPSRFSPSVQACSQQLSKSGGFSVMMTVKKVQSNGAPT